MVNVENVKRLWNEAQENYGDFETAMLIADALGDEILDADEITEELIESVNLARENADKVFDDEIVETIQDVYTNMQ